MNKTIENFGYPASLVEEYTHWVVLLRPQQATLGALILACKEDVLAFGEISEQAHTEMKRITSDLETCLKKCFGYQKMNYMMLMMVDPDVHFHVLPRYATTQKFERVMFDDPGWPALPNLGHAAQVSDTCRAALLSHLKENWG